MLLVVDHRSRSGLSIQCQVLISVAQLPVEAKLHLAQTALAAELAEAISAAGEQFLAAKKLVVTDRRVRKEQTTKDLQDRLFAHEPNQNKYPGHVRRRDQSMLAQQTPAAGVEVQNAMTHQLRCSATQMKNRDRWIDRDPPSFPAQPHAIVHVDIEESELGIEATNIGVGGSAGRHASCDYAQPVGMLCFWSESGIERLPENEAPLGWLVEVGLRLRSTLALGAKAQLTKGGIVLKMLSRLGCERREWTGIGIEEHYDIALHGGEGHGQGASKPAIRLSADHADALVDRLGRRFCRSIVEQHVLSNISSPETDRSVKRAKGEIPCVVVQDQDAD